MNNQKDELLKRFIVSQPPSRKSRSISRYFLNNKRSSIDNTIDHNFHIYRCLISVGIFDSYDLWTNITLYRDYTTYKRLFIITNKNELIIGKYNHKQILFKIKQRINLNYIWLYNLNINDNVISEITSLNDYDYNRSLIIGWPLAENFIVEFDTINIRDIWKERIESTLRFWWQLNSSNIEHVRIVIDQNCESDQNNNRNSFLIRKVISIRSEETVRDLIKKCIDAFHLQDPLVDNYVLLVTNNQSNSITHTNTNSSSLQSIQITNIPLIGHEYPYSIKMKYFKTTLINNRSFDNDNYSSVQTYHSNSSTSLNNISITNYHDFELRKRDTLNDNQTKKSRFFPKRKSKIPHQLTDEYSSSPNQIKKSHLYFFGQTSDELILKYNHQLPPIIMQLFEILYFKGPETTGIFRKVANTRIIKECINKIEHNIKIDDNDLHPILAAGLFKHFLRSLPQPLFNSIQYENWKKCLRILILTDKISFAKNYILSNLSKGNYILLKGFICILHHISEHADKNGMNSFNLGLCVSNSLFKTESTTIISGKQEADIMSSIIEFLIQNSSELFGSDIFNCIIDKHILIHQISRPTASSIESLDEVESSPHIPIINRSHDSGLAASDQLFNDDSSEISEHFRHLPNWTSSIACGKGIVLTSIIINNSIINRQRISTKTYKPSKQFLERKNLINNTTDDEDNNLNKNKIKRSKSLSYHSSLKSNEYKQQKQKQFRRSTSNHIKRTLSLKQFHYSSDEGDNDDDDDDDDDQNVKNKLINTTKKNRHNEYLKTRSTSSEQQDLDLTSEPLSVINQRFSNSSTSIPTSSISLISKRKSAMPLSQTSPSIHTYQQPIIGDKHFRYNNSLISTTNKLYFTSQLNSHHQYVTQTNLKTERDRIFVHNSNSRPFILSTPIQMKPIHNDLILSKEKYRPCHRENTLKYKINEQERLTPITTDTSYYQSIQKRTTPSPPSIKSFSFDIHPSDISWSVREKAKLFEHKLSTGRENYV